MAVKAPSPNHWTARELPTICEYGLNKKSEDVRQLACLGVLNLKPEVLVPTLLLICCVSLGRYVHFSGAQFPYLQNEGVESLN